MRSIARFLGRSFCFVLLLVTLIFQPASALQFDTSLNSPTSPENVSGDYEIRNYSNASYVTDIAIHGNEAWVGTTGGLIRWNLEEQTFIKYTIVDGLPDTSITALAVDNSGNIWIGTSSGVTIYNGTLFSQPVSPPTGINTSKVGDIVVGSDGRVWVGVVIYGLYSYSGSTWSSHNLGLGDKDVYEIELKGNNLWVNPIYTDTLYHLDLTSDTWTPYVVSDNTEIRLILSIALDQQNHLWALEGNNMGSAGGCFGGLHEFTGSEWLFINHIDYGLDNPCNYSVAVDSGNRIWVGSEYGLNLYDRTTWQFFTTTAGLPGNWVDVLVPLGDELWIGTHGSGISRMQGTSFTNYDVPNQINHNSIFAIAAGNNRFWASAGDLFHLNGGVNEFDGSTWRLYNTNNSNLPVNEVRAIAVGSQGEVWFGNWNGATRYFNNSWVTYSTADGIAVEDNVEAIATHGSQVWIATGDPFCPSPYKEPPCGGVSYFDGTTWVGYTTEDGLVSDRVYDIAIGDDGVWFATNAGVSLFDGMSWTTYTTSDGLPNNAVKAVAVQPDGTVWIASYNGASEFDGVSWTTHTTSTDGLLSNDILDIAVDLDGSLWFGTGKGLSHYDGSTWKTFGKAEGLFDDRIQKVVVAETGVVWLATSVGVSAVLPVTTGTTDGETDTIIVSPDQEISITVPPDAVQETAVFTYTQQIGPSLPYGSFQFVGASFQLGAAATDGTPITSLSAPIIIDLEYTDLDFEGTFENSILLYYWDENSGEWLDAAESCTPASIYQRDLTNNRLSVEICHLTEFALLLKTEKIYLPFITQ